jgi:hypothetical protein
MIVALATVLAVPAAGQGDQELRVPDDVLAGIDANKVPAIYIVMLEDDPVVAYDGDIAGLPATKPGKGQKVDPNSAAVKRYQSYLNGKHDAALAAVGVESSAKVYDYTVSFNGFSATMTGLDAIALSKQAGVLAVWENEMRQPTTDRSPEYLDMDSIWATFGGPASAGEDVIIGVIDTGIDPDNASFTDQAEGIVPTGHGQGNRAKGDVYGPAPDHWQGTCQTGERWSKNDCNNKLIGARWFADGHTNLDVKASGDFLSARDADGHGSHTASTAGGNQVMTTLPNGDEVQISGMAPRARIAAYKACWLAGCALADLVSAIDIAVLDGVDVINYSIGSDTPGFTGPDDVAFLFAADAGVFAATSNGNNGPGANTTGAPSSAPWLTSVGAVDHGRNFLGEVTLGDASVYSGASLNETEVSGTLVDAEDAGDALCNIGALDPAVVSGNIVLCERGVIARVDKSAAVAEAGGIGMIMFNPSGDSLNADTHVVPSIHVDHVAGPAIKAYIDAEGPGATATIHEGGVLGLVNAGVMAGFSSRGLGASEDLIKPDIVAPGVNVLAAVPGGTGFISGTSMASPHIAGIGALVVQQHGDWSPAAVKSALMTTADPAGILKENQVDPATPLDQGSGLVQPLAALDPGLVYDAGFLDYVAFLCGNSTIVGPGTCGALAGAGFSFDGSDLNQPNIAVGSLAGNQTVTRAVTNVGPAGTYDVSVDAPAGVDVDVSPDSLTLASGETASYEVTFTTQEGADTGAFSFGELTWSDGSHEVTSTLAVRPVQGAFPGEVFGEGTSGSGSFEIGFGYSGDYTAAAHGLEAATLTPGNVVDDPANDINTALSTGVGITVHVLEVGANAAHARFSLFDDHTDGSDDLDLYVFDSTGAFVAGSGSATSAEQVDIVDPADTSYFVVVHGWQTDGADANYTLFSWDVDADPAADDGTLVIDSAPASATLGTVETIGFSWSGLTAGTKYLGAVSHSDSGGVFGMTLVSVATD